MPVDKYAFEKTQDREQLEQRLGDLQYELEHGRKRIKPIRPKQNHPERKPRRNHEANQNFTLSSDESLTENLGTNQLNTTHDGKVDRELTGNTFAPLVSTHNENHQEGK